MLQTEVWDTWMDDLECTDMKAGYIKEEHVSYRGLPTDVQYWGTSQTTNGQHTDCYVGRVSVECRSRVGQ